MPALTDHERAQLKRFDPDNMPAFARFISGPEDTADIFDSTSERRLWLYRHDWDEAGLAGFFDRRTTLLTGHDSVQNHDNLFRYRQQKNSLRLLKPRKYEQEHINRQQAVTNLNHPRAALFVNECAALTRAFLLNLPSMTYGEVVSRFDDGTDESVVHIDGDIVLATLTTKHGGTLVPEPRQLTATDIADYGNVTVQALLARGVDIYAIDLGDMGIMRGFGAHPLIQPGRATNADFSFHAVNPTLPARRCSRPFFRFSWSL